MPRSSYGTHCSVEVTRASFVRRPRCTCMSRRPQIHTTPPVDTPPVNLLLARPSCIQNPCYLLPSMHAQRCPRPAFCIPIPSRSQISTLLPLEADLPCLLWQPTAKRRESLSAQAYDACSQYLHVGVACAWEAAAAPRPHDTSGKSSSTLTALPPRF